MLSGTCMGRMLIVGCLHSCRFIGVDSMRIRHNLEDDMILLMKRREENILVPSPGWQAQHRSRLVVH